VEELAMGLKAWVSILMLGAGALSGVGQAQSQGQNQGQPMAGVPANPIGGMSPGMKMDMNKPKVPAGPLTVSVGTKSSQWTAATLASLPHKTIKVFNEHAKVNQTYSGVELIDLLTPLGVAVKPHGKDFRFYLVAEGSDGYEAVYSVGEVSPDVHEGTVLVADTLDGKPIAESGPLQLVTTGEKRPARWVRNLVSIRVRPAD